MRTGWIAPAVRLLAAALCAPLVWLLFVWLAWIPIARPLRIEVSARTPTTLTVFRDLGRKFYPGDAEQRDVAAGTAVYQFALPAEARAVRLELRDPGSAIGRVSLGTGARALEREATSARQRALTLAALPAIDRPPVWLALICAAAALANVCAAFSRRGRTSITAAARWLARPETQASLSGALVTWCLFAALLIALGTCADTLHVLYGPIDNPPHWPISIFDPRTPSMSAIGVVALLFVVGIAAIRRVVPMRRGALPIAIGLCVSTLLAGNALAGWQLGFVEPTAGAQMYRSDALAISSGRDFLATFVEQQPHLRTHGRTHPPGAELLYVALLPVVGDAGWISVLLGIASMLLTAACVHEVLRPRVGRDAALFGALCFACIPAVQVYFIASLDAVICASMAGALYCFLHRAPAIRIVGGAVFVALTMFLSFAALFLVCVLFGFDLLARRSVRAALGSTIIAALAYVALYVATGFNWLSSLLVASKLENKGGFALLHRPGTYLFTRIEGVAELALFAGPMLLMLWAHSLNVRDSADAGRRELNLLSRIGVATLGLMLIAGAFKTGETARACLFLYPLIVLPIAANLQGPDSLSPRAQRVLAASLIAQTLIMQLIGNYYW